MLNYSKNILPLTNQYRSSVVYDDTSSIEILLVMNKINPNTQFLLALVKAIKNLTNWTLLDSKRFIDDNRNQPCLLQGRFLKKNVDIFVSTLKEYNYSDYNLDTTSFSRTKKLISLGIYDNKDLIKVIENYISSDFETNKKIIDVLLSKIDDSKIIEVYNELNRIFI